MADTDIFISKYSQLATPPPASDPAAGSDLPPNAQPPNATPAVNPLAPHAAAEFDTANNQEPPTQGQEPPESTDDLFAPGGDTANILSTELPVDGSSSVDTGSEEETPYDDTKPAVDAPQWQRDQWQNIVQDPDLSDQDKREILSGSPHGWGKQKKWQKSAKVLAKFRDPEVPIDRALALLEEQAPDRVADLRLSAVNSVLSSEEMVNRFAEAHPDTFAKLVFSMMNEAPQQTVQILRRNGYSVSKAEPVSVDALWAEVQSSEYYESIKDTPLEQTLRQKIEELAANQAVPKTDDDEPESKQQPSAVAESFQAASATVNEVQSSVWNAAVRDGLVAHGIRPATEAEVRANPLAILKTIVHNIGVFGMDGLLVPADEQVDRYVGSNNSEYKDILSTLERQLKNGQFDQFKATSRDLVPIYYNLGAARANIPLVRNLYQALEKVLSAKPAPPTPPVTTPVVPAGRTTTPTAAPKNQTWAADRVFFRGQSGG